MDYKLYYFNIRGRGEQIRLLLNALELPFDNILVNREQFLALKEQGPDTLYFGSLPMLEDGDYRICQGPVILSYLAEKHGAAPAELQLKSKADAIAWGAEDLRTQYFKLFGDESKEKQSTFVAGEWQTRWLPSLNGLLELNGNTGYFVGDSLTHADVATWDVLNAFDEYIPDSNMEGYAAVQKFYESIRQRPPVANYLASRGE